ncbi:MAG: lysozyme inhibitor LprI family protein, partial [Amylibacter sp.]
IFGNRRMIKVVSALFFLAYPVSAQETYNCNEPVTQMEMNACAWRAYQAADGDLNADYKQAIAYLKKADEDFIPVGAVPSAIILRDAQRAWITFRDKNCEVETLAYRGGTIVPLIIATCLESMTRVRSEQLRMIWEEN